jgi:hypothetical protein
MPRRNLRYYDRLLPRDYEGDAGFSAPLGSPRLLAQISLARSLRRAVFVR